MHGGRAAPALFFEWERDPDRGVDSGIAAGNGAGSAGQRYRGAAPEAGLIVVKMGIPRTEGFPRTTELMTGVGYVIRKALDMRMPVAVNISFGNTYGSHEPYN